MTPFLLVLSSPSGVGKSTIARHLLAARDDLAYSVSATTRAPRSGEQDGVEYHFLTPEQFQAQVDAGAFLEWATYGGHRYGTLLSEVESSLESGKNVVLDIEVAGAAQVRERMPNSIHVFLVPPDARTMVERLTGRKTDSEDAVAQRIAHAKEELSHVAQYDYVVLNDDLVHAVDRVAAILDAEGTRVSRRAGLDAFVKKLRADLGTVALTEATGSSVQENA